MLAINWKTSWPLVEAAVRDHNRGHVVGRRKDGRAVYDLKKVLRATHQHLLKEMVRLYSRQLDGLEWLHLTTELPPFRTHCGELATELDVSKGTINNLLNRLIGSGLVVQREHRGRCNRFALRFGQSIIALHPELERRRRMAIDGDHDGDAGYQAPWEGEGQTLQQVPEASPLEKENKLSVRTGDKKEKAPRPGDAEASNPADGGTEGASHARLRDGWEESHNGESTDNGAAKAGNPLFQDSGEEMNQPDSGNRGAEAGNPLLQDGQAQARTHRGARRTARELEARAAKESIAGNPGHGPTAPEAPPAQFQDHCARLLTVMVGTLWSRLDFLAVSQLEAIKAYLAGEFAGKTAAQGEETYRELWLRVGLADKWARKKPGRYIPVPSTYLAPGNTNGFERTRRWLGNMRMTTKRAEQARQRYQYLAKSIGAVLHSTGRHLEEQGLHSYVGRRKEVTDRYAYLGTAFDWIVLDPRAVPDGGG